MNPPRAVSARARGSAIILAGGRSSRFGGDKLNADLAGRSVLDRTIEAVRPIADDLLVVGRAGEAPGVSYLPDDQAFEGPLAGLATGLRHARGALVLVVAGDMPLVSPAVLELLTSRLAEDPGVDAALLGQEGGPRPLPLAVRRAPALVAARGALDSGVRSLRGLVERLTAGVVTEAAWRHLDPEADSLSDIDTLADLERARPRLRDR